MPGTVYRRVPSRVSTGPYRHSPSSAVQRHPSIIQFGGPQVVNRRQYFPSANLHHSRYDITESPPQRCRTVATTADRDRPDPQAAGPGHIQSTDNTSPAFQGTFPSPTRIPHPALRTAKKACLRPAHTPSFTRRSSPSKFLRDRGTAYEIETDFCPLPPPLPYIVVDYRLVPESSASSPTRQTRTTWR
ncbi:hypothetical protein CSOJ01_03558 [Colletotrichum sojae]|uniref:Uncharacterized protein n=1 Tax=Colletotrichum sojae TaxID=2175907 RepID=A0A8H6JME2_9PEZI|nr:hypothetical protein CSOJ01_03558 [Colletotrichum sojae]